MLTGTLAQPLSRGLASEIAARITTAIFSGELGAGERLREEALAESLGVSRGPIREALVLLERQGLVVIKRNRGAYVARLAREDVEEVYSLRLALEALAVQRAIRHASAAQFEHMQAVVDKMAAFTERGITEQEAAELDINFHELIYQASKHQRLYESWANLRPQIHIMFLTRNVANPDFKTMTVTAHQQLLDALRARDEPLSLRLTEEHLLGAYERVITSYP